MGKRRRSKPTRAYIIRIHGERRPFDAAEWLDLLMHMAEARLLQQSGRPLAIPLRPALPTYRRLWTERDEGELRRCLSQKLSIKDMASRLARTTPAVRAKVRELRLRDADSLSGRDVARALPLPQSYVQVSWVRT